MPDVPCFRLDEWPTIFVVREDMAEILRARTSESSGLELKPIEVVEGRRVRDARRRMVAFDTTVASRFLEGARTSHELWHGAHLLSEARRNMAYMIVNPLMRRYPSWETPSAFELEPCSPPLRRAGKPALGVEGPVVLAYEAHEYGGVAQDVRNAVMGIGNVWGQAARYAGDLAGELLGSSLDARDLSQWASDWLDVRFVEAAGLPEPTAQEVRTRWLAGEGATVETLSRGDRIQLGQSVLKSRRHGAKLPPHRVGEDEDLDALQFVRRFGEATVHFPSLARVAVQPWLEAAGEAALAALVQVAQETGTLGYATNCVPWMALYRWDAEILFRERWPSIEAATLARTQRAIALPTRALSTVLEGRAPDPHVAVLLATVSAELSSDEALRSWALGAFALVEAASGAVVSATPHEVIAIVPVTSVGRVAVALRSAFGGRQGTLGVGVGIGRFDEAICELLDAARDAAGASGVQVGVAVRKEGVWAREVVEAQSLAAADGARPFRTSEVASVFEEAHAALRRAVGTRR